VALGVTLVPLVLSQAQQLIRLPEWIDSGRHQLMVLNEWAKSRLPLNLDALVVQINDRLKVTGDRRTSLSCSDGY